MRLPNTLRPDAPPPVGQHYGLILASRNGLAPHAGGLSSALQVGKAAEHLVAADLILQGYSAFLADAGLPYDVLVDIGDVITRIQVKGTLKPLIVPRYTGGVYRFGLRRAKHGVRRTDAASVDYFAFVALDIRRVAYIAVDTVRLPNGLIPIAVEFKSRAITYTKRGVTGTPPSYGRFLEDYAPFPPPAGVRLPDGRLRPWRPDVSVERVVALYQRGYSVRRIASTIVCSDRTVVSRLVEAGLR